MGMKPEWVFGSRQSVAEGGKVQNCKIAIPAFYFARKSICSMHSNRVGLVDTAANSCFLVACSLIYASGLSVASTVPLEL